MKSFIQLFKFGIPWDFCLHFKDADFGNNFFSLISTTCIGNKDTIKVMYIEAPPTVTLTLTDVDSSSASISNCSPLPSDDVCSSASSHDTLPVSPRPMTEILAQRSKGWRAEFLIPRYSLPTQRFCFSQAMKSSVVLGFFLVPMISSNCFQTFWEI